MSKFRIDFFELAFLAEACIPPRPIARSMFWDKLTSKYWELMTEDERARLFEWLNRNPYYKESLEKEHQTKVFHARFDPDNQYSVDTLYNGEKGNNRCFLLNGKYYIDINISVLEEYITNINKIKYDKQS